MEDTYSTRATRATPFQYQGYSKATETRNSVFRACCPVSQLVVMKPPAIINEVFVFEKQNYSRRIHGIHKSVVQHRKVTM
jgi:hypothetical protein